MAKKKKTEKPVEKIADQNTHILGAGEVLRQNITDTLETNYMPYAMSVILSRAIPEIDGFKPSHRKLLYTMYKMGLINGARTKSANIVGQTMKLNPHGDARFTIRWFAFREATKRFCTRLLTQRVTSARRIQEICSGRLRDIQRQSSRRSVRSFLPKLIRIRWILSITTTTQ